jgi:hypothetical protein
MGLALQAMWAANVLDIQRTLHQVCKRLLREPGLAKPEAKVRAAALAELGRIYCEAQVRLAALLCFYRLALFVARQMCAAGEDGVCAD